MPWQSTPYTIALFAIAAILVSLAVVVWNHRSSNGGRPLTVLLLAVAQWSLAYGFELAATDLATKIFFAKLQYVGLAIQPVAMFAFALEYTGRAAWLSRRRLYGLLVVPALAIGLAWTNELHWLIWSGSSLASDGGFVHREVRHGPFFWGFVIFSYGLIAAGVVVLVQTLRNSLAIHRSQLLALLVAAGAPLAGSAIHLAGRSPPGLDPTPITFGVSGIALAVAILRFHLLEVVPFTRELARDLLIENMDGAVLVVDEDDRIVDCNPAAGELTAAPVEAIFGRRVDAVVPELGEALEADDQPRTLAIHAGGEVGHYDVHVATLSRGFGVVSGRLVTLYDVTDRRRREQRLDVVNRLLRHNLRNDLTVIRGHAEELVGGESAFDPSVHGSAITDAVDGLVKRIRKLELATYDLDDESTKPLDVVDVVSAAVDTFERDHPDVAVERDLPTRAWAIAGPRLQTAVDELLANAIEHNDRPEPQVRVTVQAGESVEIRVADNGPGIPEIETATVTAGRETSLQHATGVGLWMVNWIVDSYGGRLSFEDGEEGAVVGVSLRRCDPGDGRAGSDGNVVSRPTGITPSNAWTTE